MGYGIDDATCNWLSDERWRVTARVRRSAVSVMANIAEGRGRSCCRDFLSHHSSADGSLSAVEVLLLFAHRLCLVDESAFGRFMHHLDEIRSPHFERIRQLG